MKPKHKRLMVVILLLISVSAGAAILLFNLRDNLVFYYTPTEAKEKNIAGKTFRIGGLVEKNSHVAKGNNHEFVITDYKNEMRVLYTGILPDLFREGQGIVAEGQVAGDKFIAKTVLAKHDENYMPPEVHRALKANEEARDKKK